MSREFSVPPDSEPEMRSIEAALGSLKPARSTLDRDAIMFRAGQQSGRTRWAWPSATAALALISLGEAVLLTTRAAPEPRIIERIVEVPVASHAVPPVVILKQNPADDTETAPSLPFVPETGSLARQDYYHLREQALRFGVENLPTLPPLASRGDPGETDDSFRSEIRSLLDPGGTL